MAYFFKRITVYLFEVHPAISVLMDPEKDHYQENFKFLLTKEGYTKAYQAQQPIETASFTFNSLPNKELDKSHFWNSYCTINTAAGQPDYWTLQVPFAGQFKGGEITVDHKMKDVQVTVKPFVYLTAIGWSMNLKIILKGDIGKSDMISFMGWLTAGKGNEFSFKMGANSMDRKLLFQTLNNLIQNEVYKGAPPYRSIKITKQHVLSVVDFEGDVVAYRAMASADVALMRGLLFGRNINLLDLQNEQNTYPLTLTQISTSAINFALTSVEHGSLIFLQREAIHTEPVNKKNKRKVICFTENCKNCLMMYYLLLDFYLRSREAASGTDIGRLKTSIPKTLKSLPDAYTSAFCTNWFLQRKTALASLK